MSRVYFIFSLFEYRCIEDLVTEGDFIVSVSFIDGIDIKDGNYIILDSWELKEHSLQSFEKFFRPFLEIDKDIWAFANNFYETNFEYQLKIKKIISIYSIKEFVFYQKTSSYSLFGTNKLVGAEYETQRKFLYNRNSSFQNIIRNLVGEERVRYVSKKRKVTFDFILNIGRLLTIFGYEIFRIAQSNRKISKSFNNEPGAKYIYIFRSSLSCEFAKFRYKASYEDVFYFNSISSKSKKNTDKFRAKYSLNLFDLLRVFQRFLLNFIKLMFSKITYEGVNYKQSILEAQIMSLQPKLYYLTLRRILRKSNKDSIILNFEVKSPYAYFDQKLAEAISRDLVTLVYFDLIKKQLPEFFYSKILHVNTEELRLKLDPVIESPKMILNLCNLQESYVYSQSNSKPSFEFCLFTDCNSFQENCRCIEFLVDHDFDFCVRRHPRDSWHYDGKLKNLFIDRSIANEEFFNLFKYAISGASAIIQSLIDNNKPFYLVVHKGFGLTKSMHYFHEDYYGNINNLGMILEKLDMAVLEDSFKSVYYKQPCFLDIQDFYDQLNQKLEYEAKSSN